MKVLEKRKAFKVVLFPPIFTLFFWAFQLQDLSNFWRIYPNSLSRIWSKGLRIKSTQFLQFMGWLKVFKEVLLTSRVKNLDIFWEEISPAYSLQIQDHEFSVTT